jgi:predicted Zn-dependent protease
MTDSIRSFAELTDRRVLDVEPKRLEIVTLSRSRTPREMVGAYNATVPAETLALINHTNVDTRLPAGRRVKVVTGGELP